MSRYSILAILACVFLLALPACSGGGNPIAPPDQSMDTVGMTAPRAADSANNRVLWGIYHVTLDPITETAEIVPLRTADVGVNVTQFLHPPFTPVHMLTFQFITEQSDYPNGLFVLDVGLRHPFVGLGQYRGFDVRGIFFSDATYSLPGGTSLRYAGEGDSRMLNPDGWTRWWNSTEFTSNTMFGFTPGKLAPPYYPDAILNPYKYFCDDIDEESGLDEVTLENRGTFSPDASVKKRRYEIQFKMEDDHPVLDFNYAVDASWEDLGPDAPSYEVEDFPLSANCNEAWWVEIDSTQSSLYYSEPGISGGELILDVTVHDWQATTSAGSVTDEISGINMRSLVLPGDVAEIISLGAAVILEDTGVATWRLTMDAADLEITGLDDQDIWIEALSVSPDSYEPQIEGGELFPYADGPLAAYARGSVSISGIVPQSAPTVIEIIPDNGELGDSLDDVQIIGTNFIATGLIVEFDNGSVQIPVSDTILVSDTEITVDLDLVGVDTGFYDVTVTVDDLNGPGTLEGTLEDGFEVTYLPIDEYGWPFLGCNTLHNSLSEVNGPQTANQEYSVTCTAANAPETLLIGVDPDNPGDWLVYVGYYSSSQKQFAAYRASDGSEKWSVSPPSGYNFLRLMAVAPPDVPCPNGEEGTVYVWAYGSGPEKILALSAHDGSTLWEYTASSPGSWLELERFGLVDDNGDFIFCHSPSSGTYYLRCLDHTDGTTKWLINTGFQQTPDPILSPDGNTLYIMAGSSSTMRAYNLTTDPPSQKWSIYLGSYLPLTNQSGPICASDGHIYVMGRTNRVVKLSDNGSSASVIWATGAYGSHQSAWAQLAEGPDGSIYAFVPISLYVSNLYRFDSSDGSVLNQSSTVGIDYKTGMAIGADGKIYSGGRSSGIYCFNADCSIEWNVSVSGCRFTDAALLDDGSLFVADTTNGQLYRYKD